MTVSGREANSAGGGGGETKRISAPSFPDSPGTTLAICGALFGISGVVLGAFGAHALRSRISAEMLEIYRTGVLYQLFHAVALVAVAGISERLPRPRLVAALFGVGIVIFSGSLYVLAASGVRTWGAVTPFGGLALIAGWAVLLGGLLRHRRA